jgi:hypothetical protein
MLGVTKQVLAALLLAAAAASGSAQIWDKYLAPGFTYRMEVDLSAPRIIHAVRYSPQSEKVWASPELGGLKVFAQEATASRQTISEIVRSRGAIGGINGDFFPWTGDPVGLMIRDGELVSGPYPRRAIFAWGKAGADVGASTLRISAENGSLGRFPVHRINEECPPDEAVINTPAAGIARSKSPGVHVVLKRIAGDWKAHSKWEGQVESVVLETASVPVPEDGAVLTALGPTAPALTALKSGDRLAFEVEANGLDWSKFDQAIGGGPFLVKNGKIAVDWDYQGFNKAFAENRHPRTAAGRTRTGDVWFIAIDGRQELSVGATLEETAQIMMRYGCVEAVNLDGGGSTTFNLFGLTLNRPSGGVERPVANGVLFFGAAPSEGPECTLQAPALLPADKTAQLKLFRPDGARILNAAIIWQASGAGWVDQGGLLRPTAIGKVKVTAWCGGKTIFAELEIVEAPPPSRKGGRSVRGGIEANRRGR